MTDMKETTEFLDALAGLAVRTVASVADDGRVSLIEGAGYVAEIKRVTEGLRGAGKIPQELATADGESHAYLRAKVTQELEKLGVTERVQDITDRLMLWLVFTVETVLFVKNGARE